VGIKWDRETISCYTDSRGIRDLYLASFEGNVLISTRLDWFAKFGVKCSLDFYRFGSRWLAFNQLTRDSIIDPIERLGPGGIVCIKEGYYSVFRPEILSLPQTYKTLDETLHLVSRFSQKQGHKIVTLLSGGIDSRVLLASLLGSPRDQWQVCIFGSPDHPDTRIALKIANDLDLDYIHFNTIIPKEKSCIKLMREFVTHTQCIAPVTDAVRLGFYPKLYSAKKIIIDGAFGEIVRRAYFNRLLLKGKSALSSGKFEQIMPHIMIQRAEIFRNNIVHAMKNGLIEDIENLWTLFGKAKMTLNEKFLDLLAIHTRLPNLFGPEMSRLDHLVMNYMPFAQTSLLAAVMESDTSFLRNGRFSRLFIKEAETRLAKYPLVKDNGSYPFVLSDKVLRWIWRRSISILGLAYVDELKINILKLLESFIRDTVRCKDTRTFAAYDIKNIEKIVNKFYSGDEQYADPLSWWLTFELWRQECLLK
jgi:hypothetical protein